MSRMRWSWADISGLDGEIPWYVQRYCLDFMQMVAKAQEETWRQS